jgi:hypothetical protein
LLIHRMPITTTNATTVMAINATSIRLFFISLWLSLLGGVALGDLKAVLFEMQCSAQDGAVRGNRLCHVNCEADLHGHVSLGIVTMIRPGVKHSLCSGAVIPIMAFGQGKASGRRDTPVRRLVSRDRFQRIYEWALLSME